LEDNHKKVRITTMAGNLTILANKQLLPDHQYYWEIMLTYDITKDTNIAGYDRLIGIATPEVTRTNYLGTDQHGWGWYSPPRRAACFHHAENTKYGNGYNCGGMVMFVTN
jgi:hypothetical protein